MKEYKMASVMTKYVADDGEIFCIEDSFGCHYGKKIRFEYNYILVFAQPDSKNHIYIAKQEDVIDWRVEKV